MRTAKKSRPEKPRKAPVFSKSPYTKEKTLKPAAVTEGKARSRVLQVYGWVTSIRRGYRGKGPFEGTASVSIMHVSRFPIVTEGKARSRVLQDVMTCTFLAMCHVTEGKARSRVLQVTLLHSRFLAGENRYRGKGPFEGTARTTVIPYVQSGAALPRERPVRGYCKFVSLSKADPNSKLPRERPVRGYCKFFLWLVSVDRQLLPRERPVRGYCKSRLVSLIL